MYFFLNFFFFNKSGVTLAGELGFGAISRNGHQALFVSALPPARNTITIEAKEVSTVTDCVNWCLQIESCCFLLYASDTNVCTMKVIA